MLLVTLGKALVVLFRKTFPNKSCVPECFNSALLYKYSGTYIDWHECCSNLTNSHSHHVDVSEKTAFKSRNMAA
jgi:hypothetical protein